MAGFFSRIFGGAQQPTWLEPSDLAANLDAPDVPLVVDVRGPGEFTGPLSHIPGAVNIPLDQFAQRVAEVTGPDRPIVLVCHTDRRSSAAAHHLRESGVADVVVLRGGMVAWTEAGLDTA